MCKRVTLFFGLFFLMITLGQAGAIKENKTEVYFKGFGKYVTENTVKIEGLHKREDVIKSFDGEGLMGNITAKLVLRPGKTGEIVLLDQMEVYDLDHNKELYSVRPIQKLQHESYEEIEEDEDDYDTSETGQDEERDSDIRVIRQEFKVTDTGRTRSINDFSCKEYTVLWLTEWENINTGQRGTDSLFTEVWTTETSAEMNQVQQQEQAFASEYMSKLGIDWTDQRSEVLGLTWLNMFRALSQDQNAAQDMQDANWVSELNKIEGYPVLVDGKYFAIRPGQETDEPAQEEESVDVSNPGKLFGSFMKKAIKKKEAPKPEGPQPAFTYRTELMRVDTGEVQPDAFTVPDHYSKREIEQ